MLRAISHSKALATVGAVIRACAPIALLMLVLVATQPAQAGWQAPATGIDYGADYYGGACADMYAIYGPPSSGGCEAGNFGYNSGQPVTFSVSGQYGAFTYYGLVGNHCTGGPIPVQNGCATEADSQGCGSKIASSDQGSSSTDTGTTDENGTTTTGDPCNISSGNVYESANDFTTIGQSPLTSRRYYNSDTNYASAPPTLYTSAHSVLYSRFGYGWRSEYDRFIVPNSSTPSSATYISAIRADGTPVEFQWNGGTTYVARYYDFSTNGWSSTPRQNILITLTTDGTYWYITDNKNTVEKYSNTGQLLIVTYLNGYQQTFTYDSSGNNTVVSDSLGRSLTFAYLANGLVSSVTATVGSLTSVTQYS